MEPDNNVVLENSCVLLEKFGSENWKLSEETNLDSAAAFQRNVDLGRLLSFPSYFTGRVSVFLSVDNSIKLLLEAELDVHVTRGTVEGGVGPAELDTGGNGI